MSNFYHELGVEVVLQCPVCFELPQNEIFCCKVGHHMCSICRGRLTSCPSCQSALTRTRNFLAEDLIAKFALFNINESGDATENNNGTANQNATMPPSEELMENNNALKALPLLPGTYKCLLESCPNRKEMGVGTMITHAASAHAHLFDKFQNKSSTFIHNFENFCLLKGKRKYHRAFHVTNMGLFFLSIELLEDRYLNCWISIPAPVRRANIFDYQIEFSKEGDRKKIKFVSKVASNIQPLQWLLQRSRVMIIPPTKHKLQEGNFFSLHVTIVHNTSSAQ